MSDRPKPPDPEHIKEVLGRLRSSEDGEPDRDQVREWAAWALERIAELEDRVDELVSERDQLYRANKELRGGAASEGTAT